MTIIDHARLPTSAMAELEAVVSRHGMLDDVVRWALANPPASLVDVVVQDETNHDVVVAIGAPLHLVYSTT